MPLTDYTNCSYFNIRKSLRFVQTVSAQVYKRTLRFVETVKVIDITVCRNRKSICIFLLFTASTNRRTFFCLRFVEAVRSEKNTNASTVSTNRRTFFFCSAVCTNRRTVANFFSSAVCTNRRTVQNFFLLLQLVQTAEQKIFFYCSTVCTNRIRENLNYLRFLQTVEQFDSEKKIGPPPSSTTNPPQLPLQSEIKLTMILTF